VTGFLYDRFRPIYVRPSGPVLGKAVCFLRLDSAGPRLAAGAPRRWQGGRTRWQSTGPDRAGSVTPVPPRRWCLSLTLGDIPVLCGVHWADAAAARDSPVGRMVLAYCPSCAYVRQCGVRPSVMVYDTTMDTNLHHSPAFQAFSAELVKHLGDRYPLGGKRILDIGCGQGEFLRELCHATGGSGTGYDAMYAGPVGPDASGAVFHSGHAPRGAALPEYDMVTSRHWFEHLDDPYDFLVDLRSGPAPVRSTATSKYPTPATTCRPRAGRSSIRTCRISTRTPWCASCSGPVGGSRTTGALFGGMFRFIEISANRDDEPRRGESPLPGPADRARQLAAIEGFAERHESERAAWRQRIAELAEQGARPVLWGAGSRGVQFLTFADADRRLAAVVDVNPRKWGRFLPVTAHRVESPETLAELRPTAVIITNPSYRAEIAAQLTSLGVTAELLAA